MVIINYHCYRQSLQCKETTPPVQNKNFTRPPSCARRHLVFDADHDAPFNSIDSGFGDEYIIPKSRDTAGEEQVSALCYKLCINLLFSRLTFFILLVKSYVEKKKYC